MPSSLWLCNTMLKQVDWNSAYMLAELGAAEGVLSKRILNHMIPDARLQVYEIESKFVHKLQMIEDNRLQVMHCSAEFLNNDYDVIFSCLPLLSMPARVSIRILQQAQKKLIKRNGTLILFQYTRLSEKLLSRYFLWEKKFVIRNVPPAQVYVCRPR